MTVEEIKAICDSVINTTDQLDKDYKILKAQRNCKIKEIGDKIASKLEEVAFNYKDKLQLIYAKAKSIEKENRSFWYPISVQVRAPKMREHDFDTDNCLYCAYYNEELIFSTFISEADAWKTKEAYRGLRLTTDGDFCHHEAGDLAKSYFTVAETFESTLHYCELDRVLEIMMFMLENMEVLVQKLIAEVAKKIVDYTTERNAKITDSLYND